MKKKFEFSSKQLDNNLIISFKNQIYSIIKLILGNKEFRKTINNRDWKDVPVDISVNIGILRSAICQGYVPPFFLQKILNISSEISNLGLNKDISYTSLDEDFIRNNIDILDCDTISYSRLSEKFVRENSDKINFQNLTYAHLYSEDFLSDFEDRLYFNNPECKYFSLETIEKFPKIFNMNDVLYCHRNINEKFINKNKNKFNRGSWESLIQNKHISDSLYQRALNHLRFLREF